MPRATATAATSAPTSRLPFNRYATATPGRMECAMASPMKAMERRIDIAADHGANPTPTRIALFDVQFSSTT